MPRIIYSLIFELTDVEAPGQVELVAPLDRDGQSPHCRPLPPKQRVIDLRVGDQLTHRAKQYQVVGVGAYRDHLLPPGFDPDPKLEGYLVRE